MSININTQREELLHYIKNLDDKKIKAFYTLLEKDIKEETSDEYTDELKLELDKRYETYKSGKTKMVTPTQSRNRIKKILKEKL
ncbi:MAG: hypothetical protein KDD21_10805 [Bacteroidetes bacterium]|nr:hypothetical protein [Bacteroidota bacterium]